MKRIVIITIIAVVHLGLALGTYFGTFEVSGFFFGVAPQPSDGIFHTTLKSTHTVLMFPLGLVAKSLGPSVRFLAWPLMALNSLLWSAVICFLFTRWPRSKTKPRLTHPKVGT